MACGGDDDDDAVDATDGAATETSAPAADDGSTDATAAPAADDGATDTTAAPDNDTTEAPADDVNPDGVLRIAAGLVFPSGIHLDPTQSAVNADRVWMEMVFGTLFRWNDSGEIVPFMAESYEVIDPQTLNVTLRDGVTFPDGSVYDAETVKAGLERTLTQSSEVTVASMATAFKDIADITVVDPLNLTITLNTPVVGELVVALTDREGVIVSPAQAASAPADIDSNPIGAGPFVVEEFIAEQRVVLSRNPDFFDPDLFQVSGIEWINVTDGATMVNGLLSDVFDVATAVPPVDAERLDDRFTVESAPTDRSYIALLMCSGKPPLDDENVRRAVQVGIDRQAISDLVFDGLASPALGLWPEGHVNYNPALEDIVTYDPALAEELLGGASVDLDIAIIAAVPGHDTIAQVIQSQLGEVGINVNIIPTQDPVAEFITPELPGRVDRSRLSHRRRQVRPHLHPGSVPGAVRRGPTRRDRSPGPGLGPASRRLQRRRAVPGRRSHHRRARLPGADRVPAQPRRVQQRDSGWRCPVHLLAEPAHDRHLLRAGRLIRL